MTVSVVIPAYNSAATIERALHSVFAQTLPAAEIIVIDDASTDNTVAICEGMGVRVLLSPVNGGPAAARNRGFREATGEFIAILDADDAWRPDRLERLVALARETKADFVADNLVMFDAVANREGRHGFEATWQTKFITITDLMNNDGGVPFSYGYLKPLLRREFLKTHQLHYDETLRLGEDFKFYAEILFCGAKAVLTREAYYIYSTRFGEFSGKTSPFSRSSPKHYGHMVRAADDLSATYKARIDDELRLAMAKRRKHFSRVHIRYVAKTLILAGTSWMRRERRL